MNTLFSASTEPGATRQLRADHAQLLAHFHRIHADTSEAARAEIVRRLCASLELHSQLKEAFFYPALRHGGVQSPALDRCGKDHEQMRRLIGRLRASETPATRHDLLNELMNVALHHIADEETQLLPAAERFLGPERLAELGAQMQQRRLELERQHAGAPGRTRTTPAKAAKAALVTLGALVAGSMLVRALRGRHHAQI